MISEFSNRKNFFKDKGGFTLLEVIVALAVIILVFLLIVGLFNLSQNAYQRTDTKAELTQNGRVILDRLVRELRQTKNVVTPLPPDASNPDALPNEIEFQDGHNVSDIRYIQYSLDGTNITKQIIVYYFPDNPNYYVYHDDTDQNGNTTTSRILEDYVIGEYVSDIEFWGGESINAKIYLTKNGQTEIIQTVIYGRNL